MRRKMFSLIAVAAVTMLTLAGCGSNRDSSGSVTGDADDVLATAQAVGIDNCSQCHANYNQDWLEGRHGNRDASPEGPHIPSTTSVGCGNCHNQLEQAGLMPLAYPGEAMRDVIVCESCHGGGEFHSGVGPMPYPRPGVEQCAQCHAEVDADTGEYVDLRSRDGHSPAATTAVTGYLVSGHADDPRDFSTRSGTVGCNRCHSDEGAKLYRHLNDIDAITDADGRGRGAMPLGEENLSPIQCRTCHDTHKVGGDSLLMDATFDGDMVVASSQYNTCTHCHADNVDLNYHTGHESDGLLDREILDTNYDNHETAGVLEGYIVRANKSTACSDCHDVHSADLTVNTQWAQSGHGGEILQFKVQAGLDSGFEPETEEYTAAIIEAGMIEDNAPAFMHGGWSTPCQRCHTSTGASNYLDDPSEYVAANNDFSHFASGEQDGAQDEMIYCWACHSNVAAGELRNPDAINTDYGAAMPNVANSNGCVACHSGRSGGNQVADVNDFTDQAFINSHYLPAAGVLFGAVGYEYDVDSDPATDDYADKSYFKHASLGDVQTVDIVDHDEVVGQEVIGAGPCVACHMTDETGHTFKPIITDAEGVVTLPAVCSTCHNTTDPEGSHYFSADILLDERHEYHETIEMLGVALADAGHPYLGNYPYFTAGDWTNGGTLDGEMTLGAAFNFGLLHHEPGAYAHNRYYAKRLLFDSLDYLDGDNFITTGETPEPGTDGNRLDGLIVIDTTTYPGAAIWLGADENGVASRP